MQKRGPLKHLAANGMIVQLEDIRPHQDDEKYRFRERATSGGDILTFWGFCNQCDTAIFKEIEVDAPDYTSYRHQLLFSYRALLNELYKQEYDLKWYADIFSSPRLSDEIKDGYLGNNLNFSFSAKMMRFVKDMFERDLNSTSRNFEFFYFDLPRIDICTCAAFNPGHIVELTTFEAQVIENLDAIPPHNSINFLTLIPDTKITHVIVGTLLDRKLPGRLNLQEIANMKINEKMKLLSDLLIQYIETWCVSPELFKNWSATGHDQLILTQIHKHWPSESKRLGIEFNMFDWKR